MKNKILFFGLGSIGKRHLRLLKKKYDYEIYAYRTKKTDSYPDIKCFYDIEEALKIKPDIVFISNPTHLHLKTASICLREGIRNIFIEKPLSNTIESIESFFKEFKNHQFLMYVGYNMRFNPVLKRLKQIVEINKDNIYYAHTFCGSYLPNWRPGKDYRNLYSAKDNEGGGVILDLSHEFDYNQWLFGEIKTINGRYGKISNLEIDSEDFCDITVKFKSDMIASIHLDYFSHYPKRKIHVLTSDEEIIADLIKNELIIKNNNKSKKEFFNFERDYTYKQQLNYFLEGIRNQSKFKSNLEEIKDLTIKLITFKIENPKLTYQDKKLT